MFDIGFSELLLFGAIALIILGPEKLPHAARTAGKYYAKLRRTVTSLQSEIEAELDLAETRKQMQIELAKIKEAEADMKREMDALRSSMHELQQHTAIPSLDISEPTIQDNYHSHDTLAQEISPYIERDSLTVSPELMQPLTEPEAALTEIPTILSEPTPPLHTDINNDSFDKLIALATAEHTADAVKDVPSTEPMYHQWFLLSDYDKQRRLPPAPKLPNYRADTRLNQLTRDNAYV